MKIAVCSRFGQRPLIFPALAHDPGLADPTVAVCPLALDLGPGTSAATGRSRCVERRRSGPHFGDLQRLSPFRAATPSRIGVDPIARRRRGPDASAAAMNAAIATDALSVGDRVKTHPSSCRCTRDLKISRPPALKTADAEATSTRWSPSYSRRAAASVRSPRRSPSPFRAACRSARGQAPALLSVGRCCHLCHPWVRGLRACLQLSVRSSALPGFVTGSSLSRSHARPRPTYSSASAERCGKPFDPALWITTLRSPYPYSLFRRRTDTRRVPRQLITASPAPPPGGVLGFKCHDLGALVLSRGWLSRVC